MGIFDFMKKNKADSADKGMELPPVPEMQGVGGFPELPKDTATDLPSDSLPPLPQIPGGPAELAPMPAMPAGPAPLPDMPKAPGLEPIASEDIPLPPMPQAPAPSATIQPAPSPIPKKFPEAAQMPEAPKPATAEFPTAHEVPSGELVPNTIPPLEGVPEPPKLGTEPAKTEMELPRAPIAETVEELVDTSPINVPQEVETSGQYRDIQEKKVRRAVRGPIFIKADSVKDITEHVDDIKNTFRGEDEVFQKLNEVKTTQDSRLEDLRKALEDMQRKFIFIDKTLFEKQY